MSIIESLKSELVWSDFLEYKKEHSHPLSPELVELESFIERKGYLEPVSKIELGEPLSIPTKKLISKMSSPKKRTVYTYPEDENFVLKLMTHLMIRKYDEYFSPNLYSFRVSKGTKEAIRNLVHTKGIDKMYSFKADVSNYFNSIDIDLLLPKLKTFLQGEDAIYRFFENQLRDERVWFNGQLITERKGALAGCPTACVLANLYLADLDADYATRKIPYARYSDDIIIFSATEEERDAEEKRIQDYLKELNLSINPKKIVSTAPEEKWEFLGFSYEAGIVDISTVSKNKLKAKMRRKVAALMRWKRRKNVDNIKAAKAFVNVFNRKLYDNTVNGEITWTRWFFPTINTDKTLKELDAYMQDCIRFMVTEKHTKKRFDFRYEDIKALGYRNLVNEYYKVKIKKD